MIKEAQPNAYILAEDWNNEFNNVIANCGADGIGGASENITNWTLILDPLSSSLPISLREEIEQLRYQIKTIIGDGFDWYDLPPTDLQKIFNYALVTGGDLHDHTGDPLIGGGARLGSNALLDECIIESKYADLSIPSGALQNGCIANRCYEDYSITIDKLDTSSVPFGSLVQYYHNIINGPISENITNPFNPYSAITESNCYIISDTNFTPKFSNSTLEISIVLPFSTSISLTTTQAVALFIDSSFYDINTQIISPGVIMYKQYKFLYQVSSLSEINIKIGFSMIISDSFQLGPSVCAQPGKIYIDIKEIKN